MRIVAVCKAQSVPIAYIVAATIPAASSTAGMGCLVMRFTWLSSSTALRPARRRLLRIFPAAIDAKKMSSGATT